ncbi:MAG: hypothetical protein R3B96_05120 [Pirellulaceae bacterium]
MPTCKDSKHERSQLHLAAFAATLMLGSLSLNASAQDRDRYVADDDGDREQAVRIIGPETETRSWASRDA